jgi:hypothetical protein
MSRFRIVIPLSLFALAILIVVLSDERGSFDVIAPAVVLTLMGLQALFEDTNQPPLPLTGHYDPTRPFGPWPPP